MKQVEQSAAWRCMAHPGLMALSTTFLYNFMQCYQSIKPAIRLVARVVRHSQNGQES